MLLVEDDGVIEVRVGDPDEMNREDTRKAPPERALHAAQATSPISNCPFSQGASSRILGTNCFAIIARLDRTITRDTAAGDPNHNLEH